MPPDKMNFLKKLLFVSNFIRHNVANCKNEVPFSPTQKMDRKWNNRLWNSAKSFIEIFSKSWTLWCSKMRSLRRNWSYISQRKSLWFYCKRPWIKEVINWLWFVPKTTVVFVYKDNSGKYGQYLRFLRIGLPNLFGKSILSL